MHDKNGNPVNVGDKVLIIAEVKQTHATDEYCNVGLLIGFEEAHGPFNVQSNIVLNAKQIEVIKTA